MTAWLHFHFSLSCIGEGNSNPLQCSCLENPRDRRAWWAAVYGVAQSRTRLSDWTELNWNLSMPEIPLLSIHPEEVRIERDTCTPMLIAALFTIVRTWKQPWWPSSDEWIRNLCYIYTMEWYPAIQRNTSESLIMRWIKLQIIIQSEVIQKKKPKHCIWF